MSAVAVEVSRLDAERFADRIRLDLEGAADRIESAKSKIRTAIIERHDLALGYVSPGAYLSDRFADALGRLGVDARREFVAELSDAGMSTRAIAPVVGVSKSQVADDIRQVSSPGHVAINHQTSAEASPVDDAESKAGADEAAPGSAPAASDSMPAAAEPEGDRPPQRTIGLDGKTYTRPQRRDPEPMTDTAAHVEQQQQEARALATTLAVLHGLRVDFARVRYRESWAAQKFFRGNSQQFYNPVSLRAFADGLNAFADELENDHA